MMYLLYILIGLLIVLGVNLAITAFWAVHDMYAVSYTHLTLPTKLEV